MIGESIGPYKIKAPLGAGGMGEVYLAEDTRLGRKVAIKTLPAEFASDPERLARLEQEARTLAQLNHANIATVHGLEEDGDARFLIMEYVGGDTLHDLLQRGPVSPERTMNIARQIAIGLEAAHGKGIVHRDLKPGNLMVLEATGGGMEVKILDFGLAKVEVREVPETQSSPDASETPTKPTATPTGLILGTGGYMSPEQARGKPVDKRTDIWSFGCVVYEMLAGRRAFRGDTVSDALASILTAEPDWSALPQNTPWRVRELLRRCLQKDPQRRLRDIGDAWVSLEEALADRSPGSPALPLEEATRKPRPTLVPWITAVVALGVSMWLWLGQTSGPPTEVVRFTVPLPSDAPLGLHYRQPAIAVSQDGTTIAYVGTAGDTTRLFVRRVDELEPREIGDVDNVSNPFFSPDGEWLGFLADGKLQRISLRGGGALTIADLGIDQANFRGASWGPDGSIVFTPDPLVGLRRVPADGGPIQVLTEPDASNGEGSHRWPYVLPDGSGVLFTLERVGAASFDDAAIALLSLEGGDYEILHERGTSPSYLAAGQLVFARAGTLLAMPFDLESHSVIESPIPIHEGVSMDVDTGAAQYALSLQGLFAYASGSAGATGRMAVWVDLEGNQDVLANLGGPATSPRISPDGRSVAFGLGGFNVDLWILELGRGPTRFTFEGDNLNPVWAADGSALTFASSREGGMSVFRKPVAAGDAERLIESQVWQIPGSWARDKSILALTQVDPRTGRDILLFDSIEGVATPVISSSFEEWQPAISADGRLIAYTSNESGGTEVHLFDIESGAKRQISTGGGWEPRWAPDGTEVFYRDVRDLHAVRITRAPQLSSTAPRTLFARVFAPTLRGDELQTESYDVAPDGSRFLILKDDPGAFPTEINVVVNWVAELEGLVTGRRE